MGLFTDIFGGPTQLPANKAYQNILNDWFRKGGNVNWGAGGQDVFQALNDLFGTTNTAIQKGTPFYESLIPSSPGALSPAAAAEKSAGMDALQSSLGSERVAQTGQLGREYGGRLPASMVQSGFGSLARAGASGATDLSRQAILENVNLGEQGVQGLAGLSALSSNPLNTLGGAVGSASTGMYNNPGILPSIAKTAGSLAGAIGGLSGLGGGGFGNGAGFGIGAGGTGLGPGSLPLGGLNGITPITPGLASPNQLYANIGR